MRLRYTWIVPGPNCNASARMASVLVTQAIDAVYPVATQVGQLMPK
jgi:hypothetical protein